LTLGGGGPGTVTVDDLPPTDQYVVTESRSLMRGVCPNRPFARPVDRRVYGAHDVNDYGSPTSETVLYAGSSLALSDSLAVAAPLSIYSRKLAVLENASATATS
jgi:hypothetical protein